MTSKAARAEQRLNDHGQLLDILAAHVEADPRSIPCLQRANWQDWTSSDYPALKRAAAACKPCPALEACKQYADKWERHGAGVWGAKIRGRPEPLEAPPLEPPGVQTVINTLKGI